jgi:uncharacterized protein YndB with AHSA1/START domain
VSRRSSSSRRPWRKAHDHDDGNHDAGVPALHQATPEQIWDALTNPELTPKYFFASRVEFDEGRRQAYGPDGSLWGDSEILEKDPPHRLVHGWKGLYDPELADEEPSRVTWEIEQQEGGHSKLTLIHDRLEGAPKTAASLAGGWMLVLSGLKTVVETGDPLTGN